MQIVCGEIYKSENGHSIAYCFISLLRWLLFYSTAEADSGKENALEDLELDICLFEAWRR